jgi:sialate O-acetylesterase
MNPAVIEGNPELAEAALKIGPMPWCPEKPGQTYYSMIAPLIPFPMAGVIWYQGETNTANPHTYTDLFSALINSWRDEWKRQFPFYYVQIAPYRYDEPEVGVLVREAQRKALSVNNTGMVVISDIGNIDDIHPRNKEDVGIRLANLALSGTYGREDLPGSGPLYTKMEVEGSGIRVFFDHAGNGLVAHGKMLSLFEISGADGEFVPARAKIDGNTVMVSSREVKEPVAVRFAWSNTAEPNLFNTDGLPASSFNSTN